MPKLVPIVEGVGETTAVPTLLKKLLKAMKQYDIDVAPPKNTHGRGNLTKPDGLEKFLTHAANERDCGAIVLLLDAEQECPLAVVENFVTRIATHYVPRPVVIIVANRMYENWILASLSTIRGKELDGRIGLSENTPLPADCEAVNGKIYIADHFPAGRGYKETEDQEGMTRLIDIEEAKTNSRSFRRLCHAIEEAVQMIDTKQHGVTPRLADTTEGKPFPAQAASKKKSR